MKQLCILIAFVFSPSALCEEYKIVSTPLAGIYFGGEFTRSLVVGYGATFKTAEWSPSRYGNNGIYADAELSGNGRAISLGYLRTSDVGLGRLGITSLVTETEGMGSQRYVGATITMSVIFLSFRLGSYREVDVGPLARGNFTSVSVGLGF